MCTCVCCSHAALQKKKKTPFGVPHSLSEDLVSFPHAQIYNTCRPQPKVEIGGWAAHPAVNIAGEVTRKVKAKKTKKATRSQPTRFDYYIKNHSTNKARKISWDNIVPLHQPGTFIRERKSEKWFKVQSLDSTHTHCFEVLEKPKPAAAAKSSKATKSERTFDLLQHTFDCTERTFDCLNTYLIYSKGKSSKSKSSKSKSSRPVEGAHPRGVRVEHTFNLLQRTFDLSTTHI